MHSAASLSVPRASTAVRLGTLLAFVASAGCGVVPRDLDLRDTTVTVRDEPIAFDLNVSTSMTAGAAGGTLVGLGGGALASSAACAATLWFAPVCVAGVIAAGGVIGSVAGTGVGVTIKDDADTERMKSEFLAARMRGLPYPEMFADSMRRALRERSLDVPVSGPGAGDGPPDAASAGPRRFVVDVAVHTVSVDGKRRFQLAVDARVRLRRASSGEIVYARDVGEDSGDERTIDEWAADDGRAVRLAVDGMMDALARDILFGLAQDGLHEREEWARQRQRAWAAD